MSFRHSKQETIIDRLFSRPVAISVKLRVLVAVLFAATFFSPVASACALWIQANVSKTTVNEAGGDSVLLRLYAYCQAQTGTVSWEITGSAVNGVDYQSVPASGTTNVNALGYYTIATILPIDNALRDPGRTVTLHITGVTGTLGINTNTATTTIIDDDTPLSSVTVTDSTASETGPDPGTYIVSLDKNYGVQETIGYTMVGSAIKNTDYTLSGGLASGTAVQTTDADFNAGDTSNNVAVSGGSVGLLPGTMYYDPPTPVTLGTIQYYGLGGTTASQIWSPYLVARPGGGYRLYYSFLQNPAGPNTDRQIGYRDTTDSNLPSSSNLGPETLLGFGTYQYPVLNPFVTDLPGGGYRLYYTDYSSGHAQIVYRDTTDANLPDETNLGAPTVLLGTASGVIPQISANYGSLFRLSNGKYRLYFAYYGSDECCYWSTRYVETTDTNPPNATNIGAPVYMLGDSATYGLGGTAVPLSSGNYRFYYTISTSGQVSQFAYRDTTDTNPPDETNLGPEVLLGVGGGSTVWALQPQIFQLPSGQYRLNFGYRYPNGWALAYSDAQGIVPHSSPGVFTSSVLDLGADSTGATTLHYTATNPTTDTSLSVELRAGDTATPDLSWSGWQTFNDGDSLTAALGSSRYVQYRANLDTTYTGVTPTLDDLSISYDLGTPVAISDTEITLPAGSDRGEVILTPIDDTADEQQEYAQLKVVDLAGATTLPGTPVYAQVTIADDDLPEVNVAATSNGAEQGGTPGSFTISRTGVLTSPLTVNYTVSGSATAGLDYTALSGTVTIPFASGVGTNGATVSFTPINDSLIEGTEGITVTLSTDAGYVIGAAGSATADIIDNDSDGTFRADDSGIFTQTDWSTTAPSDGVSCTSYGGTWTGSACISNHTTNQNSWSTFGVTGSVVDPFVTAGQVTEKPTPQQWFQTDDSTTDRGFRVAGSSTTGFATVSGFSDAADVTLGPIDVGDGSDGKFDSSTYTGFSIPGITGTSPSITIDTDEAAHQGVYNFTDFKVAAGDTVTVTGSNPLRLYVTLDTQIDGTMIVWAAGGAGGVGPYPGEGVGPLGVGGGGVPDPGCNPDLVFFGSQSPCSGGGGGGHATAGDDGTSKDAITYPPGLGGDAYGDDPAVTTLYGGSGGGGNYVWGNCTPPAAVGGHGGGVVLIQSGDSISVAGELSAAGEQGANGVTYFSNGSCAISGRNPAGGGGGGTIKLVATNISLTSGGTRLTAAGGAGGSSYGGAGGGGRIRLETNNLSGLANASAGTGTITTDTLASGFISAGSGTYISHVQYMGNVHGAKNSELKGTETGLAALFHMNDDWADVSGNGNDATATGATFVTPAKVGSHAGYFDGNSYIRGPSANINAGSSGQVVSVEFWLKSDNLSGIRAVVGVDNEWLVSVENGKIWFRTWGSNNGGTVQSISVGIWYHVVAIWTPGTGFQIYVNGTPWASAIPTSTDYSYDTGRDLTVGEVLDNGSLWNSRFIGDLDEVAIYNRALTASEITAHAAGNYDPAGSNDSSVASPGVWGTMDWTEEVLAGTSLAVWVHSCATNDCSDRGPSDWSPVVNGQDITSLSFVDDAHAYIQYKVDMDTTGGVLPRLHDLTINTINYGGQVWFQSDDSTEDTGFNMTGATTTNTLVAGTGDTAAVALGGLAAGTGADGDFDSGSYDGSSIAGITGISPNITIDSDEVTHSGVYNFASFTVRKGDIVQVRGSNSFILKSLGEVTVEGVLSAGGYSGDAGGNNGVAGPGGGAGGAGCTDGSGIGAGAGITVVEETAGGGGGSHASAGAAGVDSYTVAGGVAGPLYGDSALPALEGGSGGGGAAVLSGSCADAAYGGGGGGEMQIISGGALTVGATGVISVDGGAGGNRAYDAIYVGGGGGGGSAGSLKIVSDQIILNNPGASLSARGGVGGSSYFFGDGGAGGDGRIHLTVNSIQGSASINVGDGSLVTQGLAVSTPVNGSYVSAIYDAGNPVSWEPVYWVSSIPEGTTLSVSLHSCALSDCSDRGPSDWSLATNAQDLSSLAYVDDGHQYLQYRVDFSSDGRSVPRLDSIAVNLRQDLGGSTLISSVYDTEDNANQIVALEWTADTSDPGTGVQFQLRTSPDGVTWGPWYGPTGTSDYYTVSDETINPVHADGVDDRYVQYKALLINTNPEYTPVLQDVTLKYITYGSGAVVSSGGSFGSGAASTESSGGGGALGTAFLVILLLGTAVSAGRHRQLGLKGVVLLAVTGTTTTAYAEFVLNFSTAGPVSGGAYKTYTVGDINSDFYQEFIIQKGFVTWQGDTGTASGGDRSNATDPLGFGGTAVSCGFTCGTGVGTGNPSKIIIWQRNRSSDMELDFLKDTFLKKPRILQSVVTNDMLSEFSVDMRGLSYGNHTTAAPMVNTLTVGGQTAFPGQSVKWDMATDSQNSHIDAGLYTYAQGTGPGGSVGTYNYNEGNFPIYTTDWSTFFDKSDPSNIWTSSANKPN